MVVDVPKVIGGGIVLAALAAGAWYFSFGPGRDQPSVTDLVVNATGSDDAKAFLANARSVAAGDSLQVVEGKMGGPATKFHAISDFTDYTWVGPGVRITVTVDNRRNEVRSTVVE